MSRYVFRRPRSFDGVEKKSGAFGRSDVPETELQALMETAPGGHHPFSSEARLASPKIDSVKDAIHRLPSRHQLIVDGLFYRQLSLRKLGKEMHLSKTHVARLREEAKVMLNVLLSDEYGFSQIILSVIVCALVALPLGFEMFRSVLLVAVVVGFAVGVLTERLNKKQRGSKQ